MRDERELQEIWYGGKQPGVGLRALSLMFGAVSAVRRKLYALGIFRSVRLKVPVIVVGNISVGGTGKTPLVIALVEALRERGFRPGVVSRGYGASARDVSAVRDVTAASQVGDEAKLIFQTTRAPMRVGRDRVRAACALPAEEGVDVIVADDGMQHYRLARDIEIAVIDGVRRHGNGRLLPAGPLREAPSRLARVDFRVCNGGVAQAGEIGMHLIGDTAHALDGSALTRPLPAFERVHAVAGIGNPDRFFMMLRTAGIDVIAHAFPDHHAFSMNDIAFDDGLPVLMTDKDAVKFTAPLNNAWRVPVRAELPAEFFAAVAARLR